MRTSFWARLARSAGRAARPDLTLSTAVYIVDQAESREARDVREPREG